MNKTELVREIAGKIEGLSQDNVLTVLNKLVDTITTKLSNGEEVHITGFGKFANRRFKERSGVNPRTGEAIKIESNTIPRFYPGVTLKRETRAK